MIATPLHTPPKSNKNSYFNEDVKQRKMVSSHRLFDK